MVKRVCFNLLIEHAVPRLADECFYLRAIHSIVCDDRPGLRMEKWRTYLGGILSVDIHARFSRNKCRLKVVQ